jgi:hypothetical protein
VSVPGYGSSVSQKPTGTSSKSKANAAASTGTAEDDQDNGAWSVRSQRSVVTIGLGAALLAMLT